MNLDRYVTSVFSIWVNEGVTAMPITCNNVITIVPSYPEDPDPKIERRASEIRNWTVDELEYHLTTLEYKTLDEIIRLVATREVESEKRDASLIRWEMQQ